MTVAQLYSDPMQNPALRSALAAVSQSGSISTPPQQDFDTPAMEGSMQQFLADNLGQYVVVEFLVGTQTLTTKAGLLYAVGTSVVTLYQELSQTFVTCDIFSVKFVTFYLPGRRPWQVANPLFGQQPPSGLSGGGSMQNDYSMGMGTGVVGGEPAPGYAPPMDMAGWNGQNGLPAGQMPPAWG